MLALLIYLKKCVQEIINMNEQSFENSQILLHLLHTY